jgi:hypothetical protein
MNIQKAEQLMKIQKSKFNKWKNVLEKWRHSRKKNSATELLMKSSIQMQRSSLLLGELTATLSKKSSLKIATGELL